MAPLLLNSAAGIATEGVSGITLAESPVTPFEHWDASADIAIVSDYRRGGVTRSGHAAALQLEVNFEHSSGWSFGADASTVDKRKGGHFEMAVHAAKSFAIGETDVSVGALWAMIPEAAHEDFGIAQVSVSRPIGPLDVTLAANYAWAQANTDNDDNLYVGLRARTPIGRIAGAPITLGASVGRAHGSLTIEDTKVDWSLSVVAEVHDVDIGLTYVDTDIEDRRGRPGFVLSFVRSF